MVIARIEALLKAKIGLDAASIGAATIGRAVRERTAASGCQDTHAYLDLVLASELELQELIEAVVVPESWFFRDRKAFAALARMAHEECAPQHPDKVLRVLSLPCSTGEEPYSMAITLLDAGIPPHRFAVDAVDISARAIARADSGVYAKNSFRDKDLAFRDRHFEPIGPAWRLSEGVRRQVRFRQNNLFDIGVIFGAQSFDAIFCRNVLIYFDRPTQVRAIEMLKRLLAPTGMLFVGPSETGVLQDRGFVAAKLPLAFAFHKAIGVPGGPKVPRVGSVKPMPAARASARTNAPVSRPMPHSPPAPAVAEAPRAPATVKNWIEEAQRLADQGNLVDALEHCERHMSQDTPSAQAFYLLGLLHDAGGRTRLACEQYRKALYLDPGHAEALVHLAMALSSDGDARGAQVLFDRARRVQAAGGK